MVKYLHTTFFLYFLTCIIWYGKKLGLPMCNYLFVIQCFVGHFAHKMIKYLQLGCILCFLTSSSIGWYRGSFRFPLCNYLFITLYCLHRRCLNVTWIFTNIIAIFRFFAQRNPYTETLTILFTLIQMNLTIVYKITRKPIQIIASYCRKNFKQIRHVSKGNFRCTLFTSLSTRMIKIL